METLLFWIVAFVILDMTALIWGADTRDDVNSAEWTRRRGWRGFSAAPR